VPSVIVGLFIISPPELKQLAGCRRPRDFDGETSTSAAISDSSASHISGAMLKCSGEVDDEVS